MGARVGVKYVLPLEQLEAIAKIHLRAPEEPPRGEESESYLLCPERFSLAVEQALWERFNATPELRAAIAAAKPVALGSWARHELCPRSDLDLLFVGDESAAGEITAWAQEHGIKIRSRVPEDKSDWTVGVEVFDIAALLQARALFSGAPETEAAFRESLARVRAGLKRNRRRFLSVCRRERRARNERYDSIANFLEPNIKYGAGGLRDLTQAFLLRDIFADRFTHPFVESGHAQKIYEYYRRFFLLVRMKTHLAEGGGDLLSAYEQQPLAEWFGFSHSRDFMREIQKGLSRVGFYADVDFERVSLSATNVLQVDHMQPTRFAELAGWLERDDGPMMQAKARELGFKLFRKAEDSNSAVRGEAHASLRRLIEKTVDPLASDSLAIAFFRSRWIDLAITDFKKIVGYVQHDQYHRYTVDAHLLQAVREMKRVAKRPTLIGRLAPVAKSLNSDDWQILGWAALYHDVGKGSGGDHSNRSVEILKVDFARWKLDLVIGKEGLTEIIWLIDNHLELSAAAFRGNPADSKVWRALHARGIEGKRLARLLVFTTVDIRATNRDAYTPWKERLLALLVQNLERPEAKSLSLLQKALAPKSLTAKSLILPCLDRLDPFLIAALPARSLARDLEAVSNISNKGTTVRVLRLTKMQRVWIRFHTVQDRPGLFMQFTRVLQTAGLSVRHASVLSDQTLGVYDWFEVKPPRVVDGLERKVTNLVQSASFSDLAKEPLPKVVFDSIECLAADEREWVISFKGRDQKGALRVAAEALSERGVSILWAKVHTWGRQIDDVFGVKPHAVESKEWFLSQLLADLTPRDRNQTVAESRNR